mmetsp:Transcript_27407/g.41723  ORF Transcript_27407/g.41723 Transcript_27407/m.41723 type:complete len:150 (-) Transcript_27407:248-697(-)
MARIIIFPLNKHTIGIEASKAVTLILFNLLPLFMILLIRHVFEKMAEDVNALPILKNQTERLHAILLVTVKGIMEMPMRAIPKHSIYRKIGWLARTTRDFLLTKVQVAKPSDKAHNMPHVNNATILQTGEMDTIVGSNSSDGTFAVPSA